jgi:hypothetical protein
LQNRRCRSRKVVRALAPGQPEAKSKQSCEVDTPEATPNRSCGVNWSDCEEEEYSEIKAVFHFHFTELT